MRPVPRALLAAVLVLLSVTPGTARADLAPQWFDVPATQRLSEGLAVDAGGNAWAGTSTNTNPATAPALLKVTPAGTVTALPTTLPGSGCCFDAVRDVAVDRANGRVWWTRSTGIVGRGSTADLAGQDAVSIPKPVDLGGIAVAADGGAWFAESGASNAEGWPGNRMAHASSALGIQESPAISVWAQDTARYDAKPRGVTVDAHGAPWFTEANPGLPGYRIGTVTGIGGGYRERKLPPPGDTVGTGPTSIAALPDGTLWYANQLKNLVGRLDPVADTITEYDLSAVGLASSTPRVIRAAPDGTLWVGVSRPSYGSPANAVVHLVPGPDGPAATAVALGVGKQPISLAVGPDGTVWVGALAEDGSGTGFIGRLTGTGGGGTGGGDSTGGGDTGGGGSTGGDQPGGGSTGGGSTGGGSGGTTGGGTTTPVVLRPATSAAARIADPRVSKDGVSANQICVGPPADRCSLVYLIQTHEYVTGFPGTKASTAARKRKTRLVTVGKRSVTLAGGESAKVTVKLNARGRKILKRDGKLNATFVARQRTANGKYKIVKTKKVRFKR